MKVFFVSSPSRSKIYFWFNSYMGGVAGGDRRFVEIAKRIDVPDSVVVTTSTGKKFCMTNSLKSNFIITTQGESRRPLLLEYLLRTITGAARTYGVRDGDILYSTSDFIPDVWPAFFRKIINRKTRWIALSLLVAPSPFYGYRTARNKNPASQPSFRLLLYKLSQVFALLLMKLAAEKVFVGVSTYNYYAARLGTNKVCSIDYGVDLEKIAKVEPHAVSRFDAIFVGRMHAQKGLLDIPDIWRKVCAELPLAKIGLIYSGHGPLESRLVREIEQRKLSSNIILIGFKDDVEKFAFMKSTKVFCCPSYYESWGMVIAEAMAAGLPVVGYDLPAYRTVFGDSIVRVPIGDTTRFALKIVELLKDSERRKKLAQQGSDFIRRYSWENLVQREQQYLCPSL